MIKKYRVHDFGKFHYSEIGEYIDEHHTDRPLRNDELVNLLNKQDKQIQELQQLIEDKEKEMQRLKLIINALNYALKNIREIDVEIDLNKCNDIK